MTINHKTNHKSYEPASNSTNHRSPRSHFLVFKLISFCSYSSIVMRKQLILISSYILAMIYCTRGEHANCRLFLLRCVVLKYASSEKLYSDVQCLGIFIFCMVMVFNATYNNISVKLWWLVSLMEETGVPGENHRYAGGKSLTNFIT